jgi:phosphate:Na+ symporter
VSIAFPPLAGILGTRLNTLGAAYSDPRMTFGDLSEILGGIGLFLLGMVLLTEGLKAVAGDSLRVVLSRFTGGPGRAFATGLGLTCLVQSSSATVLATIGFVSAGLLTFPQAVGVVLGAAVGTTSTGWIVSLLGLKFSVSIIALPLVGVGALARLLTSGRLSSAGIALAGFGLIFIGIDTLRAGMEGMGSILDPARFAGDALLASMLLVLIGILMTVVMQSSSAAVVMTLAAYDAGTITLDQGAALVIGQSMGTAVTAAIATIGASVPARRTAMAHIVFNVIAGLLAFVLLPVFLASARAIWDDQRAPPFALAGFHTTFTLLCAMVVLPGAARYAAFITRLVRDRGPVLTSRLDPTVKGIPEVAVEAARRTLLETSLVTVEAVRSSIEPAADGGARSARLDAAEAALVELRSFLTGVGARSESETTHRALESSLHAMDHLSRLVGVLRQRPRAAAGPQLDRALATLGMLAGQVEHWLASTESPPLPPPPEIESLSKDLAELRRRQRIIMLQQTAEGRSGPGDALVALDSMRWLDRIGYHLWRITHHLQTPPPLTIGAETAGETADPI